MMERMVFIMPDKKSEKNVYDDGNIPGADLPKTENKNESSSGIAEPLPESTRPRKDGPGGE